MMHREEKVQYLPLRPPDIVVARRPWNSSPGHPTRVTRPEREK